MTNILKKNSCSVYPNQRTSTKHVLISLTRFLMSRHWRNTTNTRSKHIATIASKSENKPKCPALRVICFARVRAAIFCGKTRDNAIKSSGSRENDIHTQHLQRCCFYWTIIPFMEMNVRFITN